MKTFTLYGYDGCGVCTVAKNFLDQKGYSYVYKNIKTDPEAKAEMFRRVPNATTVPQIFLGETLIGGNDKLQALARSGDLTLLMEEKA